MRQKKKLNKIKQIPFKRKKKFNSVKFFFKFGDKGLFNVFQTRIEKIYLKIIRRIIKKKYRKKRKKNRINNKYWIRFSSNLFLTKKSKNARMGSGHGKYLRSCFVLKKNKSLIEFKCFDYYFLKCIRHRIYYKLNILLKPLCTNFRSFKLV